ncbi:MAG TPA: flagellar export protein FliJ [Caulobacteraceae bacterium]|jgi:flagellar FliJ protein|nr:flagellar export protein FliJ [Caulobacteraceae bacterium]
MKWTGSLIRIAEHEIEGLRRRMAEIVDRRVACEQLLLRLAEEAVSETIHACSDAESGWYLVGFRQGWKLRKDKAMADLAAIQMEEQGARDALALAFEELKKVEHVAEASRVAKVKESARRDGAALDELGLQRRS